MRQSLLFTKTSKTTPKDEVSKNASLLIQAGFVYKEMAGVYSYLPLGLRVVEKIKNIIREEMNDLGALEIIMSSLQKKETWEVTNRWSDEIVDVWFKSALKNGVEVGFGWSHEEPITEMMKRYVSSYRDLPVFVYQFQTKLRNELRAKSGILRGREFVMKDLYSYAVDEESHERFYKAVQEAYTRIFARLGIGQDTFMTFAAGGAFTEFSHEFQTICEAGEDFIYLNREKGIAINEEVYSVETLQSLSIAADDLEKVKTAEVGNIFNFGRTKCEDIGLFFQEREGDKKAVWLGSYGIGITRVMGVIEEKLADEKGMVWPESIAPFQVHLIALGSMTDAEKVYEQLVQQGIEVLYDDREARAGEKLADADLMGIPHRIIVGKSFTEKNLLEYKHRSNENVEELELSTLIARLQAGSGVSV
jgi:prolyl-tRNA synthetase